MYDWADGTWRTPAGNEARMTYRRDSSDWNTISACLRNPLADTGDEYGLPAGLSGWALDVGAHIGSVTVGLLLDNPELRVVAIEAVPDNVTLLRQNVVQNGVADRCRILEGAAWDTVAKMTIEWGYTGSQTATEHAFIGSVTPWLDNPGESTTTPVRGITLARALRETGGEGFVWVKTDCEGCEHRFFAGPYLAKLGTIVGEWHRRDGEPESLADRLAVTHAVTWSEGVQGGPFTAVPR